jgi:hypothetical protein
LKNLGSRPDYSPARLSEVLTPGFARPTSRTNPTPYSHPIRPAKARRQLHHPLHLPIWVLHQERERETIQEVLPVSSSRCSVC